MPLQRSSPRPLALALASPSVSLLTSSSLQPPPHLHAHGRLLHGATEGRAANAPMEVATLFPDCDYEQCLIVIDKASATKHQMIDCYVQTLAKVVWSEEEPKKRIYNVPCE